MTIHRQLTSIRDENTDELYTIQTKSFEYWVMIQFGSSFTLGADLSSTRLFARELLKLCSDIEDDNACPAL